MNDRQARFFCLRKAPQRPAAPSGMLSGAGPRIPVVLPEPSPVNNSTWTPIGPGPLNNGSSGRVTALAADPTNPSVIYAGAGRWRHLENR